jgi:hypothetical protein
MNKKLEIYLRVETTNRIVFMAVKWLERFIDEHPRFFISFIEDAEEVKLKGNPFQQEVVRIRAKMSKAEALSDTEVLSFTWLLRDAYETLKEFENDSGVSIISKKRGGVNMKPEIKVEPVSEEEMLKKGFIKSNWNEL